jgi:parallel beta-helix repeat protein
LTNKLLGKTKIYLNDAMKKRDFIAATFAIIFLISFVFGSFEPKLATAESRTLIVPDRYGTINGAINNANDGDTVFVKAGSYTEMLCINKSISLVGEGADKTIIFQQGVYASAANSYSSWRNELSNSHGASMSSSRSGISVGLMKQSANLLDKSSSERVALIDFVPPNTGIIQINADNVKISNLSVLLYFAGFGIGGSGNGIKISGNHIRGTDCGVSLVGSRITISENSITGYYGGVKCTGSNNTITRNVLSSAIIDGAKNTVTDNSIIGSPWTGIEAEGDFNIFSNNNITDCMVGILLVKGANNIISRNRVQRNSFAGICVNMANNSIFCGNYVANNQGSQGGWGISLSGNPHHAENNTFYGNFVADNSYNIRVESPSWLNSWDNGTMGNYWSDYSARYSDALEIDSSGIGNIPYLIDDNNTDNYPLMKPIDVFNMIFTLPNWAYLLLSPSPSPSTSPSVRPSPILTPTFDSPILTSPPSLSLSPTPSPSSTSSYPSPSLSSNASHSPTLSSSTELVITAITVMVSVIVTVFVFSKRQKK